MATQDPEILGRIGALVDEEHQLRSRHGNDPLTAEEAGRLDQIEVELDQCWDLLNQRRALREFGFDPSTASVRDPKTVEGYQQ